MKKLIGTLMAGLIVGTIGQVQASLVYDNGPIDGTKSAWTISPPYFVSDSFTLSGATTLTSAQVGLWTSSGTPISVQWSIGTTPFASDISSGSSVETSTLVGSAFGYSLYESVFAVNGSLTAGSYWFTLQNQSPSYGFWDINNGPSVAYESYYGPAKDVLFPGSNSDSFQLYGETTPVPEPSTILAGALLLLPIGVSSIRNLRKK